MQVRLQRSHDLAAVESGRRLDDLRGHLGFNGATTSRPWRVLA